jgi:hypothetical protein
VSPRATVRRGIIDVLHLHATGLFLSSLTLRRHATDSMLRPLEGEIKRGKPACAAINARRPRREVLPLPFTYLVHRFFSVEQEARRRRAHRRERTTPSTHQPVVPSRSEASRQSWVSHVFVHEHPRNCSSRMRSCKTDAHALADNCSHGMMGQNILQQGQQVSGPSREQRRRAAYFA